MPLKPDFFGASDAYEQFMGRWSRQLAPQFAVFAGVSEGDSILDVGSGTGALSFSLRDTYSSVRVTGIDPSEGYVRAAQSQTPNERMRFVVGKAQALEFPIGAFDKALSLLCLNFVPEPEKAVREMVRVTKREGVVAAAVWDYGGGMEMLRAFWDVAVTLDPEIAARDERHMPLSRQGALATLWHVCGLDQIHEAPLVTDLVFSSFEDYWRPFFGGQGPAGALVRSMSEAQRSVLEVKLRERLLSTRPDGPFTLGARSWAVRGIVTDRTRQG